LFQGSAQLTNPGPYEVILAPIGALSYDWALRVTTAISILILAIVAWYWCNRSVRMLVPIAAVLGSLPSFVLIYVGHFPTALSIGAFTLMVWAFRRQMWPLVGVAAVVGCIRSANAAVILVMVAVSLRRDRKALGIVVGSALALLAPATAIAFVVDPTWLHQYLADLPHNPIGGFAAIARNEAGLPGVLALQLAGILIAVWIAVRDRSKMSLDAASATLALSSIVAPAAAPYAYVFAVPALMRLSLRPGGRVIVVGLTVAAWACALGWFPGVNPVLSGPLTCAVGAVAAIAIVLRHPQPA
jgi:hypothetical protein